MPGGNSSSGKTDLQVENTQLQKPSCHHKWFKNVLGGVREKGRDRGILLWSFRGLFCLVWIKFSGVCLNLIHVLKNPQDKEISQMPLHPYFYV